MNNNQPLTRDIFIKRLTNLCLRSGLSGFPKDELDQHILLKSAVLVIGKTDNAGEQEINEKLKRWINEVAQIDKMDHGTVRRWLIDTGYLTRAKDGSSYQVSPAGPYAQLFDPSIDQLDVVAVIADAREEIARRKREYLEKAKTGK